MKTKTLVARHWEDVVFENRNQDYGAYTLRRKYSDRVILGWGITIAVFAALFYVPNLLGNDPIALVKPFDPDKGEVQILPPPILPVRPKPDQQRQPARNSSSTQVVVTREPVETPIETLEPIVAASDDTGTGGAIDGNFEGTSVEPIADPIVVTPPTIPDFAEVMPRYDGGTEAMMKFIQKKIRVPNSFRYMTVGGTVYVRFVVRPDGKVTDVEVIKGLSKDCDKEAARVISIMPGWIAGMQNGTSVPVRMVLPIKFTQNL